MLTGAFAIGVAITAGVVAAVAARLSPLEMRGVAGGHARGRGRVEAIKALSLVLAAVTCAALLLAGAFAGWSEEPLGLLAIIALFGLELMLLLEARRSGDELLDWLKGAESEEAVAQELSRLPNGSWFVTHNRARDSGGNIDHVAIGPTGAFAIETKSRSYKGKDLPQALGAAMALRELTGIGWVTAVVCVPGDHEAQKRGPVWVVGRDRLTAWLLGAQEHRGQAVDVAAVRSSFATVRAG